MATVTTSDNAISAVILDPEDPNDVLYTLQRCLEVPLTDDDGRWVFHRADGALVDITLIIDQHPTLFDADEIDGIQLRSTSEAGKRAIATWRKPGAIQVEQLRRTLDDLVALDLPPDIGRQLYGRLAVVMEDVADMGEQLDDGPESTRWERAIEDLSAAARAIGVVVLSAAGFVAAGAQWPELVGTGAPILAVGIAGWARLKLRRRRPGLRAPELNRDGEVIHVSTTTIDLGEYGTRPLADVPTELGPGFTAIVQVIASWDEQARTAAEIAYDALDFETFDPVSDRVQVALGEYGAQIDTWSCQTGREGEPWTAGPWLETIPACTAEVASAVLARDFGLITKADFEALTNWWTAAGLSLPPAREGATFAADADEVEERAVKLGDAMGVEGWPLAAVAPAKAS